MKKAFSFILIPALCAAFSGCGIFRETAEEKPAVTSEIAEAAVKTETETSAPERDYTEEILEGMSLEEKVGQVILARFPDNAAEEMALYHFGGYTLYAKDFENHTPESISASLDEIGSMTSIQPFFAADEEGGDIVRISKYAAFSDKPLPSVQEALSGGMTASEWSNMAADVLESAGINLDLAPVADVAESESDYIYDRTCGLGCGETGEVIAEIVRGFNGRNMVSCLKHFPGYGSNVDTHTGIALDNRTKVDFEQRDFLPFKSGIEAGAPMVMVNHNIVAAYNENVPASLAPEVHEALRGLGFEGIIITDDLGMDAVALYTEDSYAAAFLAGNDMLCTSDGAACFDSLYEAVKGGVITEKRLNESVLRIIRVKIEYSIIGE